MGCLLLARYNGKSAGCGAFRALDPSMCELKRLYVRPAFQGQSIGKRLTIELIRLAYELGYSTMRLETTTFMTGALALYTALGFRTCAPHYEIPQIFEDITVFMELDIRRATC
jgi:putative acetyltransferase